MNSHYETQSSSSVTLLQMQRGVLYRENEFVIQNGVL